MKLQTLTPAQLKSAERTLASGTWAITVGAIVVSLLTATPFVQRGIPAGWEWTAPITPVVVDVALVIVIRMDAVVAQLGGKPGGWPLLLRWFTGGASLFLNTGDAVLRGHLVYALLHAIAPVLLIITAETGLHYRAKIAGALAQQEAERLEQQRAEQAERDRRAAAERQERQEAEHLQREQEAAEQDRAERLERERLDREERLAREAREHEAAQLQAQRDHEAATARERAEREERLAQQEADRQDRREAQERAERLRREQQERERIEAEEAARKAEADRLEAERTARAEQVRAARENKRAERSGRRAEQQPPAAALNTTGTVQPEPRELSQEEALTAVEEAFSGGLSQRKAAVLCGRSPAWVNAEYARLRTAQEEARPVLAAAG